MRYVLAIVALVFSGLLLLLGIGQRTFLAGPSEIRYEASVSSQAGYAVIDGAEFAAVPGQANVSVAGEDAVVATGSTSDVQAWVEPFDHVALTVDSRARDFTAEEIAGVLPEDDDAADDSTTGAATDAAAATDAKAQETAALEPLDPRGSDLWLQEVSATDSNSLRVPVKLETNQSVIITTDGTALPEPIAVVWVQDRSTPWAGPLLVAGGVLAVVGAVLYLLAIDHDRRGLGPRRGRKGPLQGIRNLFSRGGTGAKSSAAPSPAGSAGSSEPGASTSGSGTTTMQGTQMMNTSRSSGRRARNVVLPAAGLAIALGLTGCSASYWPQFGADSAATETADDDATQTSVAPVPVTDTQLDMILDRVVKVSDEADAALDAEVLKKRFTGDALAQRTANYAIREVVPEWLIPPLLTSDELDYQLVQSTESWPRTMLVTVASTKGGASDDTAAAAAAAADADAAAETDDAAADPKASPSLALVLTQESPHDNYLVSSVISLRGGLAMPQAAPAEEGTALLANDIETFLLPPGEVGAAFASVLQDGEASPNFDLFDLGDDTILETSGKARVERLAAEAEANGKPMAYSVVARQGDATPIALTTGVEGALVVTTVLEDQVVDGSGGRIKPVATGQVTALSGLSGQQERIVQTFAHQMLFFVPSKVDEGAKIQLLGDTSELIGAGN